MNAKRQAGQTVVFVSLPAVKKSPESVWHHADEVQEVKLKMLHCLEAIERIL